MTLFGIFTFFSYRVAILLQMKGLLKYWNKFWLQSIGYNKKDSLYSLSFMKYNCIDNNDDNDNDHYYNYNYNY